MSIRWGIIGVGDVAEIKSGPGFQKAEGSALVAVMRRDRAKVEDFARRHGVPKAYTEADALIHDPEVDAVYIATPPSSHCDLALRVAAARKPCLLEKPMAVSHAECLQIVDAFQRAKTPLWVAYYRRALPRFLKVRELIAGGAIGRLTSMDMQLHQRLATGEALHKWVFDRATAGAGLFFDMGSHCVDLFEFFGGRIAEVSGCAVNTGGRYQVEDVIAAAFKCQDNVVGAGIWNFNSSRSIDQLVLTGSEGELRTAVFASPDIILTRDGRDEVYTIPNPPHVHQPLIQTVVDELLGRGRCESTGESGARASWFMDRCLAGYYA